jgi:hypothetical protein
MKVIDSELPAPRSIESMPRPLSAPEFTPNTSEGGNLLVLPGVDDNERASARG